MIDPVYAKGDATDPQSPDHHPRIIAHIVNDMGKWGAGFVLSVSKRWPSTRLIYQSWAFTNQDPASRAGNVSSPFILGEVMFQRVVISPLIIVANMLAQSGVKPQMNAAAEWEPPIRYEALEQSLQKVAIKAKKLKASVHMPRIGCGLAGGHWSKVEPIIICALSQQDIPVTIYDLPKDPLEFAEDVPMLGRPIMGLEKA